MTTMPPHSFISVESAYGSTTTAADMLKTDPDPAPVRRGKQNSLMQLFIRGGGMFCESYFLFSVGNLEGIFKQIYPECWGDSSSSSSSSLSTDKSACPSSLLASITYTEIVGVIFGMLVIGSLGDRLGRRWGSRLVSGIMLFGAVGLCIAKGSTVEQQFIVFTVALGISGIGVGGEYPMASSTAAETSEPATRGKNVITVFSMQGLGILVNTAIIALLLVAFDQTGQNSSLDKSSLELIWRLQYALGVVFLFALVWYRFYKLEETQTWKREMDASEDIENVAFLGKSARKRVGSIYERHSWIHEMKLLLMHFWHRVLGSGGCWFVWDVTFYGNKLFQGRFISMIEHEHTIFTTLKWTLINAAIAYVGYFVAAYTMDLQWMGRRRMQTMGFAMVGVIFFVCGFAYNELQTGEYIHIFQLLYFLSSFFGQWGPNATTFLLPSEIFPTELRGTAHGISASSGKVGALVAGIVFSYIGANSLFLICGACGTIGLILTLVFVPDTTGLDLDEIDQWWDALQDDSTSSSFVGAARYKQYLSWFERVRYGSIEETEANKLKSAEK